MIKKNQLLRSTGISFPKHVKIPIIDHSHTQRDSRKKKCSRGQYRSSQTQTISEAQQHKRLKGNDLFSKHSVGTTATICWLLKT
jgi:hypothetical protein